MRIIFLLLCLALTYVGWQRSVAVNNWYEKCGGRELECE